MSETELLDLQISIARVFLLKKCERYKAEENEGLRRKRLREYKRAEHRLDVLQAQRSQGGITP